MKPHQLPFLLLALGPLAPGPAALATDYTVAESEGDFTSIQAALDVALAADTIPLRLCHP